MLGLWVFVALLAAAVTIAAMWPRTQPRDHVNAYIRQVNAASRSFGSRYKTIEKTFRTLSFAPAGAARQLPQVRASAQQLTLLRRRVEAISPPRQAARLRQRLVAFLRQQEAVAWELESVSVYLPKVTATERPLAPASARMRAALATGKTGTVQGKALRAYAASIDAVAAKLRLLHAPPLFAGTQRLQLANLQRTSGISRRLAAALGHNDRSAVKKAVDELGRTPSGGAAIARAAVKDYDRRVARIRALGHAVEVERQRLAESLS